MNKQMKSPLKIQNPIKYLRKIDFPLRTILINLFCQKFHIHFLAFYLDVERIP